MTFSSITDLIFDDRLGARPGSPPYLWSTSSSAYSSPGACGCCTIGLLLPTFFATSGQRAPVPERNSEQQPIVMEFTVRVNAIDGKELTGAVKAMRRLGGLESVSINSTEEILTVPGDVDPAQLMETLSEMMHAGLVSVGPAPADREVQRQNV